LCSTKMRSSLECRVSCNLVLRHPPPSTENAIGELDMYNDAHCSNVDSSSSVSTQRARNPPLKSVQILDPSTPGSSLFILLCLRLLPGLGNTGKPWARSVFPPGRAMQGTSSPVGRADSNALCLPSTGFDGPSASREMRTSIALVCGSIKGQKDILRG
jgi:hypothetical protein